MERFMFKSKNDIEKLPKTAGVYLFKSGKEIIYIGKAINIRNRVKNHFQQPSYRDDLFIDKVDKIGFLETNSEIEALILEASLIKKVQPKFNVVWRDDKNYFYVAIVKNKHKIPYIYVTHQPRKPKTSEVSKFFRGEGNRRWTGRDEEKLAYRAEFIGPFVEGAALKKTLKFLRRVFPYYTAGQPHQKSNCTYCYLRLCPGPNPDLVAYKKNIKSLVSILSGKRAAVLNSLKKEMKILAKEKKYEQAAKIRDRVYNLQQIMAHTRVIGNQQSENGGDTKILSKIIGVKIIKKIECYDVSNIQGKYATGSMVVFMNGQPNKSQYKKFKIVMKDTPDDIAMLKEVLGRRLSHKEWPYPEAILIDGGKAQLNVAINAKNQKLETKSIKVISIAKGRQELFIEGRKNPIPLKNLPQEAYNLIKLLDDEAHRFAITYHKKLRKRSLLT